MDKSAFVKNMEAKAEQARKDGFENWLSSPEVRALVSMIPPGENKDLLRLVLQSAFNSGFRLGQATTLIELITAQREFR